MFHVEAEQAIKTYWESKGEAIDELWGTHRYLPTHREQGVQVSGMLSGSDSLWTLQLTHTLEVLQPPAIADHMHSLFPYSTFVPALHGYTVFKAYAQEILHSADRFAHVAEISQRIIDFQSSLQNLAALQYTLQGDVKSVLSM